MASALTKKRLRTVRRSHSRGKGSPQRVGDMSVEELSAMIQTLIERRLSQTPESIEENRRARLVDLARRAEGNWKLTEPQSTAVEIVRKLREEW